MYLASNYSLIMNQLKYYTMRAIVFILLIIVTACSKEDDKKELVKVLVMNDLNSTYKPADLEGLEIKIFTASPRTLYSNIRDYEYNKWKSYAKYSLSMPHYQHMADSIYNLIGKNLELANKYDSSKIYYEAYTHIFKMDTTMKTNYFFDDSLKIIAVHRIR